MTYNEKKFLYESIMKDVSKIIKNSLNDSNFKLNESFTSLNEEESLNKFASQWEKNFFQEWRGFCEDYKKFKENIYDSLEQQIELITKVSNKILEALEYISKSLSEKLNDIENRAIERHNKKQ